MIEIENNLLRRRIQTKLSENLNTKLYFKNVALCGKSLITSNGALVVRRKDKNDAKLLGLSHCGNGWLCPVCAAKTAAKTGRLVAGALEVAKQNQQAAFMATFTIGHCRGLSCALLVDVLHLCWKRMFAQRNSKTHAGEAQAFMKKFQDSIKIHHIIKACELTWSFQYGWHPHFHALFFVDADKIDKVKLFEKEWAEQWEKLTLYYLTEALSEPEKQSKPVRALGLRKINSCKEFEDAPTIRGQIVKVKHLVKVEEIADIREHIPSVQVADDNNTVCKDWNSELAETRARLRTQIQSVYSGKLSRTVGVFISKDRNGDIVKQNSCSYITGWKADSEICGVQNAKKSTMPGRFTLTQIMQLACEGDQQDLFTAKLLEAGYALYKMHPRFSWTHTGLKKAANAYLSSLTEEQFKKKFIGVEQKAVWQTVCYIPSPLFERLLQVDNYALVEESILQYAMTDDFLAICELIKKLTGQMPMRASPYNFKYIEAAA